MTDNRVFSPTQIHYFMISELDSFSYVDYLVGPRPFHSDLNNFLKAAPFDLLQLFDAERYFYYRLNRLYKGNFLLSMSNMQHFEDDFRKLPAEQCKVIIISELETANITNILKVTSGLKNACYYIICESFDPGSDEGTDADKVFVNDIPGLLGYLVKNTRGIIEGLIAKDKKLIPLLSAFEKNFEHAEPPAIGKRFLPHFHPAHSNFYIMCQTDGNYWRNKGDIDNSTPELLAELRSRIEAGNVREEDLRYKMLIESARQVDGQFIKRQLLLPLSGVDPLLPPLILCVPFQNPQSEKIAKLYKVEVPQAFNDSLLSEQISIMFFQGQAIRLIPQKRWLRSKW